MLSQGVELGEESHTGNTIEPMEGPDRSSTSSLVRSPITYGNCSSGYSGCAHAVYEPGIALYLGLAGLSVLGPDGLVASRTGSGLACPDPKVLACLTGKCASRITPKNWANFSPPGGEPSFDPGQ